MNFVELIELLRARIHKIAGTNFGSALSATQGILV